MNNDEKIKLANERFTLAQTYWKDHFNQAKLELDQLAGDQWDQRTKYLREQDGRPCLTLNRISNFIRNLNTRNREANLQIKISDENDDETTKVVNELIRQISSKNSIENHLDSASYYQIANGLSFIRLFADFENYYDFDQKLKIETIPDPSNVLMDPSSKEFLMTDSNFVFIFTKMTKDEFLSTIGKNSKIKQKMTFSNKLTKSISPLVIDKDTIIVTEYYYKEFSDTKIYKYVNPISNEIKIIDKSGLKDLDDQFILVNEKDVRKCEVKHCLFDGVEFYNETTIPSMSIPVIPVIGEDIWLNDKRKFYGAVKHAMDAQKILNYSLSISLEVADLQAKTPWLVEESSISGYEHFYRDSNSRNYAFLPFKKTPPIRSSVNTDISALMSIKQESGNDIQQIFGVFDTQLGEQSTAESGVAINARNSSSNKNVYVYKDNLMKSVKRIGEIIIEMLPEYYNGQNLTVKDTLGNSNKVVVNLDKTKFYDVTVTESKTDANAKQDLNIKLMDLATKLPSAAPLLIDAIVKNSDINDPKLISRLQTLLPPGILDMEKQDNMSVEDLRASIFQSQQQLAQLTQQIQELTTENESLKSSSDLENRKLELEQMKLKMEYDIKSKELLVKQTEIELDFNQKNHELSLNEQKLAFEAVGIETDNLSV